VDLGVRWRPLRVVHLVQTLEIFGRRSIFDSFADFVCEAAHYVEQLHLAPEGDVEIDPGQQGGEAVVATFEGCVAQLAECVERIGRWRVAAQSSVPVTMLPRVDLLVETLR
jgi:hypothetical protein